MRVPTRAAVTDEPLDAAALLREALASSDGAALLFWGVVREENDGRRVTHLEYEAYREMAERELGAIVTETRVRWEVGDVVAVHRLGRLEVGEASVAIVVAAPHRVDAYEASRYVIEELKRRVPIWKREGYVDGDAAWLPGVAAESS